MEVTWHDMKLNDITIIIKKQETNNTYRKSLYQHVGLFVYLVDRMEGDGNLPLGTWINGVPLDIRASRHSFLLYRYQKII